MTTITELQARARALSSRTETDSITPEEVGGLQRDSIDYMAELERSGKSLGIRKVYASVDEMEAAGTSPVGEDGKALKYGQLASIYHAGNAGTENGNIYAFQNPGWLLVGNIAGQKVDIVQSAGDSESAAMSQKAVTALLTEYDVSAANGGRAYTLADAIAAVPAELRKSGLTIKFVDSDSSKYAIWNCDSSAWDESSFVKLNQESYHTNRVFLKSSLTVRAFYDVSDARLKVQKDFACMRISVDGFTNLIITSNSNQQASNLIELDVNGNVISAQHGRFTKKCIQTNSATRTILLNTYISQADDFRVEVIDMTASAVNVLSGEEAANNLLNGLPTTNGYYTSTGAVTANNGFVAVTEFVEVRPGYSYTYYGYLFGSLAIPMYDENKKRIGYINQDSQFFRKQTVEAEGGAVVSCTFAVPDNCHYLKLSARKHNGHGVSLYLDNIPAALSSEVQNQSKRTKAANLLNGLPTTNGYYTSTGAVTANNGFVAVTEFVEVRPGYSYTYYGYLFGSLAIPMYDENKKRIGYINQDSSFIRKITDGVYIRNAVFRIPANCHYIKVSSLADSAFCLCVSGESSPVSIGWTIPAKIYAIKGCERSIYVDNIVNRNDDAPAFSIGCLKTFGAFDGRRFHFTPTSTGTLSVLFNAYNSNNELIGSRTMAIEVIDNVLSAQKTVLCIGDSITEAMNMPYYIQEGLKATLSPESIQPTFVGTKGGPTGMAHKATMHEGWYGRSYQWLAGDLRDKNTPSPLVNPGTNNLDISYYRTSILGISQKIDVVNLAMGFNNTFDRNDAKKAFSSMQKIIAAFKADNADTRFIVQLVTYPAMGLVLQENGEERVAKKNSVLFFRNLCLDTYNSGQDPNIIIGDLGLSYDRWYAYKRSVVRPASYYATDSEEVVTDRVHPSADGTKEMGESSMHSILKMLL